METMNIFLPEQLKEFIDEQVGSGRYGSVSEYVHHLVRNDVKQQAQERLESWLIEGIESGLPTPMTPQD